MTPREHPYPDLRRALFIGCPIHGGLHRICLICGKTPEQVWDEERKKGRVGRAVIPDPRRTSTDDVQWNAT